MWPSTSSPASGPRRRRGKLSGLGGEDLSLSRICVCIRRYAICLYKATNAITIITFLLLVISVLQFIANERALRAFVFPSKVEFIKNSVIHADRGSLELEITLENSGNSTATVLEFRTFVAHHLPPNPDYSGDGWVSAYPPIVAKGSVSERRHFGDWSQVTAVKVKSGEMNFYVFGFLIYQDKTITGGKRQARFCFRYSANDSDTGTFRNCIEPAYTYAE